MEGNPAEEEIIKYSNTEQYNLGLEAGKILKIIHSYDKESDTLTWWEKYEPKSIRKIHTYLDSELKRINQDRLITIDEFIEGIDIIFNNGFNSGDVFRIDIKGDKLWVEKM